MTLPADFSSANLNVGSSLPARSGSGTLFMKLGSPPTAAGAVRADAAAGVAVRNGNASRLGSDTVILQGRGEEKGPKKGEALNVAVSPTRAQFGDDPA